MVFKTTTIICKIVERWFNSMPNISDKATEESNLIQKKQLQLGILKESGFTLVFFIFALLFVIESFRYPIASARLPQLVGITLLICIILQFILIFTSPEKYVVASESTKSVYPKRLIWLVLGILGLAILWYLIDFRVAILIFTEFILISLGVRKKIVLILMPIVLTFVLYYLFTKLLYIRL